MSFICKYITVLVIAMPLVSSLADTLSTPTEPARYRLDDLKYSEQTSTSEKDPQARLGFITYNNDAQGYQGTSSVTPLKIELGGVFIGTLIGLGLVLLAPKVSELFSHHHSGQYHGAYSRSDDQNLVNGLVKVMSKIDETLQENNIDSVACLERAACSYAQSSKSSQLSSALLDFNSSFPLLNFVIEGSKLKTALDKGLSGENCSLHYPQCSITKNTFVSGIRSFMAGNSL